MSVDMLNVFLCLCP